MEEAHTGQLRRRRKRPRRSFYLAEIVRLLAAVAALGWCGTEATSSDNLQILVVDIGSTVSLPCVREGGGQLGETEDFEWVLPNRANATGALIRDDSGDLVIRVDGGSGGLYLCRSSPSARGAGSGVVLNQVEIKVRTVPDRVTNLTTSPHSVYATVSWSIPVSLSHSVDGFLCQYRRDTSHLAQVEASDLIFINTTTALGPESRTCDLYNLLPNTTYYVKVSGYNQLGMGDPVSAQFRTTSPSPSSSSSLLLIHTCTTQDTCSFLHKYNRIVAVSLSLTSLSLLLAAGSVIGFLVYRHRRNRTPPPATLQESPEDESLELVPHITLNPSFNIEMLEHISPDYQENSEHQFLVDSHNFRR